MGAFPRDIDHQPHLNIPPQNTQEHVCQLHFSGHIAVAAVALAAALGVGNDDEDGGRCGSKQQNQQQQKQLQRFSWGTAKIFLGLIAQTAKEQKQAMKTVIWSTGFDSGRKPLPSAPSWVQTRN